MVRQGDHPQDVGLGKEAVRLFVVRRHPCIAILFVVHVLDLSEALRRPPLVGHGCGRGDGAKMHAAKHCVFISVRFSVGLSQC